MPANLLLVKPEKSEEIAKISILFPFIFCLVEWGQTEEVKGVTIKPNRSIILGKVQRVKRNFPYVTLMVKVIRSYTVERYANSMKKDEIIEIQPDYTGKEFKLSSFFEEEENLNNFQACYFFVGDCFFAEVSLFGDEKKRKVLYFTIQRVNQESALRMIERPDEFLKSYRLPMSDELPSKSPREYAKLASVLYELINSPDRSDSAERHQLYLSQD